MAAGSEIKTKISLNGEREYRDALTGIGRSMSVLSSEMKLSQARFVDNAASVESLSTRDAELSRQLDEQRKKIEVLRAAHANAAETLGETDVRTVKWQISLNRAETAALGIEHALSKNAAALETARAKMDQYGLSVDDVAESALTGIGDQLATLGSEIQFSTVRYAENANSVQALAAQGTLLRQQQTLQARQVDALNGEYQLSAKRLGENNAATLKLRQQLNGAQTTLLETGRAVSANASALEEATRYQNAFGMSADELKSKSGALGDTIKNMADKIGIVLPDSAQRGITALNLVDASTVALVGTSIKMVRGLIDCSINASKTADDLLTLSTTTGVSTDKLQEFKYATELIDVSMDTFTGALTKLTKNMAGARGGTGDAAEAFKTLHVQTTAANGGLRDAQTVFYEAIDALGKIRNETERDALAMQIFGKSAQELNPLIEAGSARLKELGKEAHDTGYVMSGDTLGSLGALDDAFQRFDLSTQAVKNSLALALLPVLTSIMELIAGINPKVLATLSIAGIVIATIAAIAKSITVVSSAMKIIDAAMSTTTLKIIAIISAVALLVGLIAILVGKANDISNVFTSIGDTVDRTTSGIKKTTRQMPSYASGTNWHPGGWAMVGEEGPETVWLPRGSAVSTARETAAMRGGDTITINVDAHSIRQLNDIYRVLDAERVTRRMGRVRR